MFEIWQEIFQQKKVKTVKGGAASGSPSMQGAPSRSAEQQEFHRMHNLLSG
jgi:hypothetical protein